MSIGRKSGCRIRRECRVIRRPACEIMERRVLLATLLVTNTDGDTTPNSLAWAIEQADSSPAGTSVAIDFQIAGTGPLTIDLASPLPVIDVPVTIDGTTQPGYQSSPLIEIDGSGLAGAGDDGLVITAGDSMIRGLSLVGFSGSAIVLQSGDGNVVASNYLGLDPSGAAAAPNGQGLTLVGSSYNTIGAGPAGLGNVISANSGDGILVEPGVGADSAANLIVGNLIGTSPDGRQAIGNGGTGIAVQGADANSIGMAGHGLANVISGNAGSGIGLSDGATANAIQDNIVGLAADGETPIGNQGDGILLDDAPGTLIGGTDPGDRNVIGANRGDGIATIGDTAGLLVAGNSIGTDASGTLPLGNQQDGVCLASSFNTIGGTIGGAANIIAFNGAGLVGAGVQLVGSVNGNTILSNSIEGNAGLGINFGAGPTPEHAPGTPGPNDYQNYPALSIAQDNGAAITVDGTLSESPNTSYLVQIFASPQEDPSGYGQGQTLLGTVSVQTDANGNASFTMQLKPGATPGSFISATATDPLGNTSEFSADVPLQGQINLSVSGAAAPNPVPDGSDVTYTLTVANQGTSDAQFVNLNDQIPPGLTVVSVTSSQGYAVPEMGDQVDMELGTVQAGASATVTIVAQTGASSVGTITDSATVSSQETDPYPADETTSIPVTVETAADLSVAMTEGPAQLLPGDNLTYTMTVSNQGPQVASDVAASLPIAPGLSFVSASSTAGTVSVDGSQVVASLSSLSAGSQDVVTVVLQAAFVGSYSETATVSGAVFDPQLANNSATVTTMVVPGSDLAVQVASDTDVAASGIPLTYTVTVSNLGPSDATNVEVDDTLPAGANFVSASVDPTATSTESNGVLSVGLPSLAAGSSSTITIVVNPTATPGSTLVDSATVQGDQLDLNPANNQDTLSLPVRGVSDLSLVATAQPGSSDDGQTITYMVAVTNNGPADEPDAVLTSVLPPGLVVDSSNSTQGTAPAVSQGILTADLGTLPAGQTADLTLIATPGPSDVGTMSVKFEVQGQNDDPDSSNNTATASVVVAAASDLGVQIMPGNASAIAGVAWSYSVVVTNAGPSAASGVVATIPVPAGATFVSASPSQGSAPIGEPGGPLTADLGTIASGASATITVVIDPAPSAAGGTLVLSAQVSGDQDDPTPSNNQELLDVSVYPSVSVALTLNSTPQVIQTGQVVTFTAKVVNAGSTAATGVVVAFPQLNGLSFVTSTPGQGTPALVANQFFAQMGSLSPGASATVTVQEMANSPGTYSMTASVSEDEYNLDLAGASATTSAQVVESPGMIEFGASSLEVTDQSGVAVFPVARLYGDSGTITVHYQTTPLNATPGVDFTPTSGTLTLGPGQWSGSIQVPILDDPYLNHDTYLDLTLDSPTGGADLGPVTTMQLHIQDVDPDLTPPQVSGLTWSGSAQAITSLTLQFTAPLDPAYATDAADYQLSRQVGGQAVPIASITYNTTNFTVTIVPQSPIPSGQYDRIQVVGTGSSGIRDVAGNLLDGNGDGEPGSDYVATFAQGAHLKYVDNSRNVVRLAVKGPGYLEQVLGANGNGVELNLLGMVPHRTTLTGHITARKGGSGQTEIGQVTGLGQFGDVKVLLKTPPFLVNQFPFQRRGKFVF